ncbi:zinc ribbon domain-containing protein, partial [Paracoccus versutus]|uniref:zinc ribbon domain-containing protein n=1 Tax=Paracoccus versutus TaxID=34007 RepID=UPI000E19B16B
RLFLISSAPSDWADATSRRGNFRGAGHNVGEGIRRHFRENRLNGTHRPKTLLSGLVFCGCCGGPYAIRGSGRFACSTYSTRGTCTNNPTIPREVLEDRVLAGLKDRLMTPEAAEAAVRSYAEELNRLNREHRANTAGWENELGRIEKQIAQIVEAIADGMYHPSMKEKLSGLEARKQELAALLAEAPRDVPDMLPNAATLYARKIARLIEALNQPEERQEAAATMWVSIEKIVLTPGPNRGEVYARLQGDLATILEWVARQEGKTGTKTKTPGGIRSGVLVSLVAGACNYRCHNSGSPVIRLNGGDVEDTHQLAA